jgi:hypothetical protein
MTADEERAAFEAMLKRSGLSVSEAQKKDLLVGYRYVAAMAARVRGDGRRPREAEPASIFKPEL